MYVKLTNEQLDLASSYERFRQSIYGNVIRETPSLTNEKEDTKLADHWERVLMEPDND